MDSFMVIIAIFAGVILIFVFPLMTMADRTDDVVLAAVKVETKNFVDTVASTGKLTLDDYSKFVESINSTGNRYAVEMQARIADENAGKIKSQVATEKSGEAEYYILYDTQIFEILNSNNNNAALLLKEGDYFSVYVKVIDSTLAEELKNFIYAVAGKGESNMATSYAAMVSTNGEK